MASRTGVRSRITGLFLTVILSVGVFHSAEANGTQLIASWVDNSSGVAMTRVERRAASEAAYTEIADAPPGASTFVDTSVAPGATYCYRVFAWVEDGVSPYSDEVCATSAPDTISVTISKTGTGSGTVTSAPAGINCGTTCSGTFYTGTLVTLSAAPAAGSLFDGWSGNGCSGTGPCSFAGNAAVAVTASFSIAPVVAPTPSEYAVSVAKSGPGTVRSVPAGIDCGSSCAAVYPAGATVTLTALPNSNGTTFTGWNGGGCAGSALTCTVNVNAAAWVSATFKNGKAK